MKVTSMLRLFYGIATGGFGLALAIDSSLAGHSLMAALFTTGAMVLLLYGWFDLKDMTATKSHVDVVRDNVNTLLKMNAKRSADAALYVKALQDIRDTLYSRNFAAATEVCHDALAEFNDPATAVRFCVDWMTDLLHDANKHWWTDPATGADLRNERYIVPTKLMLTVSEIAEAMEADRKQLPDDKLPQFDGLTVEMADALFRIFDLAGAKRLPMGDAAAAKFIFNISRPDHMASARMAVGGKAY
ncbi:MULTISPECIES: hypothetical protein [Bradyrhizobium]|uniref:hypothetical protein n=1 Tax=Bradyrhizobium TaxID=374 RepID=UPI000F53DD97|nr:hypothetical protein [Bradyrhizobium sp. RP6]RQH15957.1 hypothetical protein EHH60_01845 [Bradyrhizobium sp. RP6]